jgi:hypothetical protein
MFIAEPPHSVSRMALLLLVSIRFARVRSWLAKAAGTVLRQDAQA